MGLQLKSRKKFSLWQEIVVDNFAGGGGASTGISLAIGRSVDIAINHDPSAINMHKANHPDTEHYSESVWDVDPKVVTGGRPVALCWFSPDCKHFSKAKGGKPVEKKIRGLAWIVLKWASKVKPRELFNAQAFPGDYIIDTDCNGKKYPKSAQVARCGNAVPPVFAEALVKANLPDMCYATAEIAATR